MLRTILITFAVFFAISSGAPAKVTFSTTWFDSAWNAFYVVLFNSLGRIVSHRPGFLGSWLKHHTSIRSNMHNYPKHTNTHEYRRIHTINIQVAYKCARVTNGYIRLHCWNVFLPAFYREWEGINLVQLEGTRPRFFVTAPAITITPSFLGDRAFVENKEKKQSKRQKEKMI